MSHFTITTNKKIANRIIEQYKARKVLGAATNYEIGKVMHEANYSVIQVKSKKATVPVDYEDIFWLGYHTNGKELS